MSKATRPDKPRIGWIDLGKMGLPICERLAAQQFQLTTLTTSTVS
jgi:3-hydroxyisobutyrate dehydrogenase-like beta-hydroxyacid dehydrogenase